MFEFFRRNTKPIMIIALIGFLATIIFAWGMGINGKKKYDSANLAAVINGEEITWNDYKKVYDNLYSAEQQKTDEDITEAKKNELYNTAWSQVQYERLIQQQVAKYEINVSDDELYDFLKFSPPQEFINSATFQTNGQFDYQKYMSSLADPNFASFWANSDQYFRNEIKKLKFQEIIIQAAHVSENDVKDYFIFENEKIKIGIINVGYAKYSRLDLTVPSEEALAYYNDHKEDYSLDEQAVLKVISIEKKPSQLDWDDAENQIKQILDTIKNGADFGQMAKIYSQDGSASRGGDLGLFAKGQMVPEFDKMVFSMSKGEVSNPVKTQFGWHIIKHFGFKKEDGVEKVRASHILIKVVPSQETLDKANEKLRQFQFDTDEYGFDEAASRNGMTPKQTAPFLKGANIQFLGKDIQATEFAFNSELDAISPVYENTSLQYVAQLVEKLPKGIAAFDLCEKKVRRDIQLEKIKAMCADTAAVIWSEIQNGSSYKSAAKKHNFDYYESDAFARGGYIKGLRNTPKVIGAAFALKNKDDGSGPVDYNQGTALLKLLDRTPVDLNTFTAQRDSLSNVILSQKQKELFSRWYENLVENSEIVNNIQSIRTANLNY